MSRARKIKKFMKQYPLLAIAFIILIFTSGILTAWALGIFGSYFVGGGSIWRMDYKFSKLELRGTDPMYGTALTESYTTPNTPYEWTANIDGDYDVNSGAGRLPGVVCTVGIVGRVDRNGNELSWKEVDPDQVEYEAEDRLYKAYYYLFDVKVATSSQSKTNLFGVPGCEYGEIEVTLTLTLLLDKSIFDNDVQGHFGDARIHEVEVTDPLINPEFMYWQNAAIDVIQDQGDGLAITEPTTTDTHKEATILLHTRVTCGGVRAGLGYMGSLPYNVWIVKRVLVTMLLSEPIETGHYEPIDPFDPPPLGLPWWLPIAIIGVVILFIFVIVIAAILYVRFTAGKRGRR